MSVIGHVTGGATEALTGGTVQVGMNGLLDGVSLLSGSVVVENGGTADNTLVDGGATEIVLFGGTASGVTFVGTSGTLELAQPSALVGTLSGWQTRDTIDFLNTSLTSTSISGSTLSVTVNGGATFTYQLAGLEANTAPGLQSDGSGGTEVILGLTVIGKGQTVEIFSGQTSTGITVLSGGIETVESGGTAINTVVSSGGSLVVLSDGFADPTVIYTGGSETISAGGTDTGAQISGGTQFDYGPATGATIFTGSQVVRSGGVAKTTAVFSGGTELIDPGGTGSGTIISSGGSEIVFGIETSGTILSGAFAVGSGGIAAHETISSGGTAVISSGATATSTTILSGGTEIVSGHGTDSGSVLSA